MRIRRCSYCRRLQRPSRIGYGVLLMRDGYYEDWREISPPMWLCDKCADAATETNWPKDTAEYWFRETEPPPLAPRRRGGAR